MPTTSGSHERSAPGWVELATSNGNLRRSVATGVVVGTILTAVNQGDVILAGEPPNVMKIVMNYLIPYVVATYGAASAKRAAWKGEQGSAIDGS